MVWREGEFHERRADHRVQYYVLKLDRLVLLSLARFFEQCCASQAFRFNFAFTV